MTVEFDWSTTDGPKVTQMTCVESQDGVAFAAGKRGVLIERTGSAEWETLVTGGPTGNGLGLHAASMTDDGKRIWYCGNSGAFGYYDREEETIQSHHGPGGVTSTMRSVSVSGPAGEERVTVVDAAGRVIDARVAGDGPESIDVSIPGSGTAFTEIVNDRGNLFASDTAGNLYFSRNGSDWRHRRLAQTTIKGMAVDENGVVAVTDGGKVFSDISLFEQGQRTRTATFGVSSPEDVTARGGVYVIVGGDGSLVPITRKGDVAHRKPGPGVTFYGAEIMDDGTVLGVGSTGKIVEGAPTN